MALDFFAGCLGGCAGVLVGHPFDTVKVKLQTQDFRNPQYRGTFDCLRSIVKNESMSGLYKGVTPPLAGVAVVNAIVFGVYGNTLRRLSNPDSLTSQYLAGATAGFVQSFICSPMEMVKIRLQTQKTSIYKNSLDLLSHIYKKEGYRGVFRGLNITILREAPGFGSFFACYEYLTKTQNSEPISTPHMLMAGGTAGAVSWLLAYPVDVIKTRVQVDGMSGQRMYKNSWDCLIKSVHAEGPKCLFRGLTPTLVRAFPTNAATWAVVTWTFRLLGVDSTNKDDHATLSEVIEQRRLEDLITAQMFKLPEYSLFYNYHHMNFLPGEYFPKNYFVQFVRTDDIYKTRGDKKDGVVEEGDKDKEKENQTIISKLSDDEKLKSNTDDNDKRQHVLFRGDENLKGSTINKCEKEFSYFDNFIVSLCSITSKSFS